MNPLNKYLLSAYNVSGIIPYLWDKSLNQKDKIQSLWSLLSNENVSLCIEIHMP